MINDSEKKIEVPLYTTTSIVDFLNRLDTENLRWTLTGSEREVELVGADGETIIGKGKCLVDMHISVAPGYSTKIYLQSDVSPSVCSIAEESGEVITPEVVGEPAVGEEVVVEDTLDDAAAS